MPKKNSQLNIPAESIAQINIEPKRVEQNIKKLVNINLYSEKVPPVPSSDLDEMDEVILSSKLKELSSDVKTSSHRLITQIAEANKLANQIRKKPLEEEFLLSMGLISFSIGEYEESIKFHTRASEVRNFEDNFLRIVANICCIGSSLLLNGDVDKALEKYQESVKIIEMQQRNK
jgi:tetratricopeptide (TPR) repeat protein